MFMNEAREEEAVKSRQITLRDLIQKIRVKRAPSLSSIRNRENFSGKRRPTCTRLDALLESGRVLRAYQLDK